MVNLILVFLLAAIIGGAAGYIIRAKRRGVKCVGCPDGGTCGKSETPGGCPGCCGSCGGCGKPDMRAK